ncbi:aldose epimerase family protein [Aquimarina litoralis]|uniref:aldose epimerase family protein n=1 Tax=Aquimarina litoralis TaxID=584605 RepID=UPI001C595728|nr:aldose epimerase family protein [Aquimarina litoralis]MBW1294440.1 galactose mutarotase [Aquimarina litoralis]
METLKRNIKQKSVGFHGNKELFVLSLSNGSGMKLRIANYGATIMSLEVPDHLGNMINVIVGFDSLEQYIEKSKNKESRFLGASIGRYAGRISGGKFTMNCLEYPLYQEEGVHLHGGKQGFDEKVWDIEYINEDSLSVSLSYLSEHLEEGYPGSLRVKVTYQLTDTNELKIRYDATSTEDTFVNLTNHAYYNLNGSDDILNHELLLHCSHYLEVDDKLLPTGILKPVEETKLDFTNSKCLEFLEYKGTIDDTLIFDENMNSKGVLISPKTKIKMEFFSNQPGIVLFTPKKLPEGNYYGNNVSYGKFPAICFEMQNYSDAPNKWNFPSVQLKAGELYDNSMTFKFSSID